VICPQCSEKTIVSNTRTRQSIESRKHRIIREAYRLMRGYDNWVVRRRRCSQCDWSGVTIELLTNDFRRGWFRRD